MMKKYLKPVKNIQKIELIKRPKRLAWINPFYIGGKVCSN